jgi:exodeoxyribonuclease-3
MRLLSWNVNGLRAGIKKGFLAWLESESPDVLLMQETKARAEDLPLEEFAARGYVSRFLSAERLGYSGVGILARREPDEWVEGIGVQKYDSEGRVLAARYGELLLISAYFPNSQHEGKRLPYRLNFGRAMHAYLRRQQEMGRKMVLSGDFNVAHRPIDLARPKQNEKNPGYLPEERGWMDRFLARGYLDTWRHQHPEEVGYSWWSMRSGAREKNIGWRLDYFCVEEDLESRMVGSDILPEVTGSDHCPVVLELEA